VAGMAITHWGDMSMLSKVGPAMMARDGVKK
jgi:hypothetical protein